MPPLETPGEKSIFSLVSNPADSPCSTGETLMKLEFVINWGYQILYSSSFYHPVYCWDGSLVCSDEKAVMALELLNYPVVWCGICYSPEKTPIPGNSWQNVHTCRAMGGLQVTAECDEHAKFILKNRYGEFTFSAAQLQDNTRLEFPVGSKYGFCVITINRHGHYWFRPEKMFPGMVQFTAGDLPLRTDERRRMIMAELPPEKEITLPVSLDAAAPGADNLLTVHLQCMLLKPDDRTGLPDDPNEKNNPFAFLISEKCPYDFVAEEVRIRLTADDGTVLEKTHYFRYHDFEVQLMEDIWFTFPVRGRISGITISQHSPYYHLWIEKITCRPRTIRHLTMEMPRWAIAGKPVYGRIYAVNSCEAIISGGGSPVKKALSPGWNEVEITCPQAALDLKFTAVSGDQHSSAVLPEVYALAPEEPEVMVGCDFTTVPHDGNGDMDQLLEYISRTQMGNTVVFRNFRPLPRSRAVPDDLLARWGKYCADHRIHVQSVNCHASGALVAAAGKYMHNGGWHEIGGIIYAGDPDPEKPAETMPEAMERYIAFLKKDIAQYKKPSFRYGYGDAGGGARYLFQAGVEYIRAETMVPHTQHLCSLVRPASRIFGKGDWGVHIAIQHSAQPYVEQWHLGHYFLSLYQAWAMGANNLYEEDSLFILFKDEPQSWDDRLTKTKRQMTRDFMKFAATHPRKGTLRINIASLEGRYEAPFNGFICNDRQDPTYSVWGQNGNAAPEWGHLQPEKKRHLLDVFMPGASTHPLRQQEDKRRLYFSGTPYGDFDQFPVEAEAAAYSHYKLLLNLGWHTANAEDQAKIEQFVAAGGTYFAGITEYSQHIGRKFLLDMEDLALWNQGDLRDFAGIRVLGRGAKYSGSCSGISGDSSSSRTYSFSPDEDGECYLAEVELCGAEVVAADRVTGKPLIVKNHFGKGTVYTLTAWAYPGHDKLAEVMAAWLRYLGEQFRGDIYIDDPSSEVFWNVRESDAFKQVTLLNTDWTVGGNKKQVTLHTPDLTCPVEVKEGEIKILYLQKDRIFETTGEVHLSFNAAGEITAHGSGTSVIREHAPGGTKIRQIHFTGSTTVKL